MCIISCRSKKTSLIPNCILNEGTMECHNSNLEPNTRAQKKCVPGGGESRLVARRELIPLPSRSVAQKHKIVQYVAPREKQTILPARCGSRGTPISTSSVSYLVVDSLNGVTTFYDEMRR